jgi:hypothetical protein
MDPLTLMIYSRSHDVTLQDIDERLPFSLKGEEGV